MTGSLFTICVPATEGATAPRQRDRRKEPTA